MNRLTWLTQPVVVASALLLVLAMTGGACGTGDEAPPRSTGPSTSVGTGGFGGNTLNTGNCEGDEIQECKVWIDENNCFVGEQQCVEGEWGPCVEPETLDSAAFGPQTGCPMNPCNPGCQEFNEVPPGPLEAAATVVSGGSGDINDIPSAWQDACLHDMNHACMSNCSSTGACQFDTRCMPNPGAQTDCVEFGPGEVQPDAVMDKADYTIKTVCDPSAVEVCNRSNFAAGMGVGIVGMSPVPGNCGGCGNALKDGFSGSVYGYCEIPSDIPPGSCITVDCSAAINGTTMLFVNSKDHFDGGGSPGPYNFDNNEHNESNNWSIFHPSSSCTCAAASTTGSIGDLYLYISLDTSNSMDWTTTAGRTIMEHAQDALSTFYADPGTQGIYVAHRGWGDRTPPGENCNTLTDGGDCLETSCDNPEVDWNATVATNQAALQAAVAGNTTNSWTPHWAALGGAGLWAEAHASGSSDTHAIVYISDGGIGALAGTCGYSQAQIAQQATDAWNNEGVYTYAVALPGANIGLLTAIATAGQTTVIDLTDTGMYPDPGTELASRLSSIAGSLASCSINITNTGNVDPSAMLVELWPAGNMGAAVGFTDVGPPPDGSGCTGATNEFYLDDYTTPTTIELCPSTCTDVQMDATNVVNIEAGCQGGFTQQVHGPFDYQAVCDPMMFPGAGPVWEYLTYDTDVPAGAGAEVVWEMRTGNTPAELAANMTWITVATSTNASPDAAFGSMTEIDLQDPMRLGNLAQQAYMELRITVTPTNDGSASPLVHDWDIQFSCEDNE